MRFGLSIRGLLVPSVMLVMLAAACTRTSKPWPQSPPRIGDSPPEQRAALNEAANLGLPQDERRFGVEQQKELKRQAAEKAEDSEDQQARRVVIPMPPPNDSGVFGAADAGTAPR